MGSPLEGHTALVISIAFLSYGKLIISGSLDGTIRVWDIETGQQIGDPFVGHAKLVTSVAFSPNGKLILSGSSDHILCVWTHETNSPNMPVPL
ncbi:hypothetical protein ID866_11491 [Astraeus odoratus]|nr:hypothetical protein ID866_11491 [Astraeus odoratus]